MRLSVQRRAATGLSFSANYTLSRCFGLEMGTAAQFGATYTDPTNPDNDRGYCDQDRTHIANATVGIETPQFSNAILRTIASNWGVSAILTRALRRAAQCHRPASTPRSAGSATSARTRCRMMCTATRRRMRRAGSSTT